MTTIRIPIVPNAITTFTDETEEHCIRYKTTIQIDKAPLKISPELLVRLIKAASELDLTPKGRLVKKRGYGHVKKIGGAILLTIKIITNKHRLLAKSA